MSHELRTPLNAIIGFSQVLEMTEGMTEADLIIKLKLIRQGNHLLTLINEILDLSKIESGKIELSIENIDLSSLIAECVSLIQPVADKNEITINYSIETDLAAWADYTRLKQALLNLLSNGIKCNKPNGKVNLVSVNKQENRILFEVTDTGHGISKDNLDLLFQPFELVSENSGIEGTGIGLSITQKIIDIMNGYIGVENDLGKGSVFWIDLPARQPEKHQVDNAETIILKLKQRQKMKATINLKCYILKIIQPT